MTRTIPGLLLAAAALLCWGCAPDGPSSPRRPDPALPAALARAVAATDSVLAAGAPADSILLDHLHILELRARLGDAPTDSAAAAFIARWEESPGDIRLLDTAFYRRRALADHPRWEALLAAGVGRDTTVAPALFAAARGTGVGRAPDLEPYLRVEAVAHRLGPAEQVYLQRVLANVEDDLWEARAARDRRLAGMTDLLRVGGPSQAALAWYEIAMAYLEADEVAFARTSGAVLARCADAYPEIQLRLRRVYVDGCILAREARFDAALDSLTAMERRAAAHREWAWASQSIGRQALVERARGRLDAAVDHVRRSLALAEREGWSKGVVRRRCVLAEMSREMGRLDDARFHLEVADSLQAGLRDAGLRDMVDLERLRYALQLGDFATADRLTSDLLARPTVQQDAELVRDLKLDLMTYGLENDRPDLAYRSLEHLRSREVAVHRSADYDARMWVALRAAELHARQGEFVAAAAELDSLAALTTGAVGAPDRWLLDWTRGRVAELMDDPVTAEAAFRDALATAVELGDPDKARRSRVGLGRILLDAGRWVEARELFASGLDAPEFWTAFVSALSTGQAYAGEGRHAEAVAAYERAGALLGADVSPSLTSRLDLARARSEAALGRPEAAWRRLAAAAPLGDHRLPAELADVTRAFHRTDERDRAELMLGLLADHPRLAGPEGAAAVSLRLEASLRRVAGDPVENAAAPPAAVRPGDLALRFFLGRDRWFAWSGTAAGWRLRELADPPRLRRRCRDVAADLTRPGGEVDWEGARDLAVDLLGPDAAAWEPDGTLHLADDGVLQALPWPALPWPGGAGQLVDRGPLRHGAPAGAAAAGQDGARGERRLLAVGVDGRGGGSEGSVLLREAEREAREVAELFPGPAAALLLGEQADWDHVRGLALNGFDVLHVATHASVSHGRRGHSTLRFRGDGGDRPVTARELRGLPLAAELVYLSCCEGAQKAVDQGSGVDSLARAFLQAGARTVVASTQVTDDEASRLLARRFYAEWLSGSSPHEALRSAQRSLRDRDPRWRHPFYWASLRVLAADD